jgi:hypothetical protein
MYVRGIYLLRVRRDLSIRRGRGRRAAVLRAAAALNALISPFARATMGHTVEHWLGGAERAACTCQSRGYRSGIDVHVQARPRMQHGKMPLVGGPIVTFALPPYRVCKAMIWLWDKVVAPCLRAVWKACLSPCLLAVWRTCVSPCLLKLHKVLAPCLPWVRCCIQTANRAMQVVDLAHMSDSSDSD